MVFPRKITNSVTTRWKIEKKNAFEEPEIENIGKTLWIIQQLNLLSNLKLLKSLIQQFFKPFKGLMAALISPIKKICKAHLIHLTQLSLHKIYPQKSFCFYLCNMFFRKHHVSTIYLWYTALLKEEILWLQEMYIAANCKIFYMLKTHLAHKNIKSILFCVEQTQNKFLPIPIDKRNFFGCWTFSL